MTKLNPTDYWQQQMFNAIRVSHPYLLRDREKTEEIIIARAEEAYEQYLSSQEEGKNVLTAREEAREVLLNGYKWSPTDFLASLVYEESSRELDVEERVELYFKHKGIFDEYSGIDLNDDADKENELREKLLEAMK